MQRKTVKRLSIAVIAIVIIAVGAWAYLDIFTKKTTQTNNATADSSTPLEELVKQSSAVVIGKVRDTGTNEAIAGGTNAYGDKTATTRYIIDTVSVKYPSDWALKGFGLVMPGGTGTDGKAYSVSGIPQLKQNDEYLIFVKLGKDGFFRPLNDGFAVAQRVDDIYTLPTTTILNGSDTFSQSDLATAISTATKK